MVSANPEAFIILAKAYGFSSISVGALLSIGPWRHRLTPEVRSEAMAQFSRLSVAEAKRKMAHWNNDVVG